MKLPPWALARIKGYWTAFVVLVLALLLTFAAYLAHSRYMAEREEARFAQAVPAALDQTRARLSIYLSMLRGVQAFYGASQTVTPEELARYFESLKVHDRELNKSMEGVGVVWKVPPNKREAHNRSLRTKYPNYRITSSRTNETLYPVIHFEALATNANKVLGWDVAQNELRRAALTKAEATGDAVISARTQLLYSDGKPGPSGFLMYLPILSGAKSSEGRHEVMGFVFGAFDSEKLFRSIFPEQNRMVTLEVYDGTDLTREHRLFVENGRALEEKRKPLRESTAVADMFGRPWSFHFETDPVFEKSLERRVPALLMLVGTLGSLLLFGFVYGQIGARKTAEVLSDELRASETALKAANSELGRNTEKIAAEKDRLAVTLEAITDGVVSTDREGRILLMNPVAERMCGLGEEAVRGMSIDVVFPLFEAESRKRLPFEFAQILHAPPLSDAKASLLINGLGEQRLVRQRAAPTHDSDGRINGAVFAFRDVSQEQKAEQELLRASKLESIGLLAGGIAHDFNNVLTGIVGNLSLLKVHPGLQPEVTDRLSLLERSAYKARQLTMQLLTFAKGGSPIKQTASIVEVIRESTEFALRGSNLKAEFEFIPDIAAVEIDTGQMSQVIQNLVINAKHATPNGGLLRVFGSNIDLTGRENLPIAAGAFVRVSIQDFGCGISAEHLGKIFDPYFTTKETGTGLGLATAYSILKRHDGLITVESELGRGSTFHLYLPASKAAIVPTSGDTAWQFRTSGNGRILVMDDEAGIRTLLSAILKHFGYDVTTVADGADAIREYRQARDNGQRFAAVIMDLTIPGGMGGKETIRVLREIDQNVKAIVCSGYSNDPVLAEYQKYGFIARVEKPYRMQELGRVLSAVLQHRT
jgi:PAS domain S-box-containing protein